MQQIAHPPTQPAIKRYEDLRDESQNIEVITYANGLVQVSIIAHRRNGKSDKVATATLGTTDAQDMTGQLVVSRPPQEKIYY
jgi:hypothetical protein